MEIEELDNESYYSLDDYLAETLSFGQTNGGFSKQEKESISKNLLLRLTDGSLKNSNVVQQILLLIHDNSREFVCLYLSVLFNFNAGPNSQYFTLLLQPSTTDWPRITCNSIYYASQNKAVECAEGILQLLSHRSAPSATRTVSNIVDLLFRLTEWMDDRVPPLQPSASTLATSITSVLKILILHPTYRGPALVYIGSLLSLVMDPCPHSTTQSTPYYLRMQSMGLQHIKDITSMLYSDLCIEANGDNAKISGVEEGISIQTSQRALRRTLGLVISSAARSSAEVLKRKSLDQLLSFIGLPSEAAAQCRIIPKHLRLLLYRDVIWMFARYIIFGDSSVANRISAHEEIFFIARAIIDVQTGLSVPIGAASTTDRFTQDRENQGLLMLTIELLDSIVELTVDTASLDRSAQVRCFMMTTSVPRLLAHSRALKFNLCATFELLKLIILKCLDTNDRCRKCSCALLTSTGFAQPGSTLILEQNLQCLGLLLETRRLTRIEFPELFGLVKQLGTLCLSQFIALDNHETFALDGIDLSRVLSEDFEFLVETFT